jgi:hypothetical protein
MIRSTGAARQNAPPRRGVTAAMCGAEREKQAKNGDGVTCGHPSRSAKGTYEKPVPATFAWATSVTTMSQRYFVTPQTPRPG